MSARRNVILALAAILSPLLLSGAHLAVAPAATAVSGCPHAAEAQKHPSATPDLARIGGGGRTLFY